MVKPTILANPNLHCPADILAEQVALVVSYRDFDGVFRQGIMEINKTAADDVAAFFAQALERGFPIAHVVRASDLPYLWEDDRLTAANATSGFNYRTISGTSRVSWHGYGLAFDVNPVQNPYMVTANGTTRSDPPGAVWQPGTPGTLTATHPLVTFMKQRGWEWGGDWKLAEGVIDYQHFQKPR